MPARRLALLELHGGLPCMHGMAVVQWYPVAFDGVDAGAFCGPFSRTAQPYTFTNVVIKTT